VLVVSEELDELFEICDRLHVIAKGRLSPSLDRAEATTERVGEWMSGLWQTPAPNNDNNNDNQETAHAAA
jgi:general nucleoside transport system ATP-binding protein